MTGETPDEQRPLERLDDATRDVGWQELDRERERERFWRPGARSSGRGGSLAGWGFRWRWRIPWRRHADPDPGDERGLRDVLHGDERKE